MARLLVIDGDHDLASSIALTLRRSAHEAIVAKNPEEGLAVALTRPFPGLTILVLAPSATTGFRVLRALRERGYLNPVLVVATSTDGAARVQAFRLGADQYMTSPFGAPELLARTESLLVRAAGGSGGTLPTEPELLRNRKYAFGSVVVELATRQVYRSGHSVKLAPLEFELLVALLRRHGAATTRAELLREVWKYGPDVMSRTLDTHILNLREKLEDEPSTPRHILTVRKLGYRLDC